MTALAGLLAVPPSPVPTSVTPGFGPTQGVSGDSGASAGLYAFLLVVALVAVSVVIFVAMSRSLQRARTNLGGSVLPRREADRLPVAPQPQPPTDVARLRTRPDPAAGPDGAPRADAAPRTDAPPPPDESGDAS